MINQHHDPNCFTHTSIQCNIQPTMPPKKRACIEAPDSNPAQDALETLSNTITNLEQQLSEEKEAREELLQKLEQAEKRSSNFKDLFNRWRERTWQLDKELKESKQQIMNLEKKSSDREAQAEKEKVVLEKKYAKLLAAAQGVVGSNALGLGQRIGELNAAVGELQGGNGEEPGDEVN